MKSRHNVLNQIIAECDSMLFHTRPNLPYRGLSKDALVAGIKIIRGIAKTGMAKQTKTKPNAT